MPPPANVSVEWRGPAAVEELREQWRDELEDAADYGSRLVYGRAPVKTGFLRRNSGVELEEDGNDLLITFFTRKRVHYGAIQEKRRAYLSTSLWDTVDYLLERRHAFGVTGS